GATPEQVQQKVIEHAKTWGLAIDDLSQMFLPEKIKRDSKNTAQMFLPEADTQSPEFKAWFGNSTVINADGTPKLVFHGTRSRDNFNTF
ncbi:hypothetical protein R0J87_20980, partial [Halomonas sp. SIMBA_159]